MKQYISKSALVAEMERRITLFKKEKKTEKWSAGASQMNVVSLGARIAMLEEILSYLDTLEVKEVNIAEMADDYYDALMKEAAVWMDENTMCHCRLAYYTGCKDVLNKIRKGE